VGIIGDGVGAGVGAGGINPRDSVIEPRNPVFQKVTPVGKGLLYC